MSLKKLKKLLSEDKNRFNYYNGSKMISWWITSSYRIGCYLKKKSFPFKFFCKIWTIYYRLICLTTGVQLPLEANVGGGLFLPHFSGIVLTGDVIIGRNCTIHQGCTIGRIHFGKKKGVPKIGDNVVIYPGANVSGNVTIGNNVVIGANSVVLSDVPDGCVVGGAPSKILSFDSASTIGKEGRRLYWCQE